MCFVVCLSSFLFIIPQVCCGPTRQAPPTCATTTCNSNQYCQELSGATVCRLCDEACKGCTGFGPTKCKECQLGFRNVSTVCEACPAETFGFECEGTCRCLYQPNDCNRQTGDCASLSCAQGWSGPPQCQTPCSSTIFGPDCNFQCHCPPEDSCSPVNGLCSSNQCDVGWSSAGCQNELPQLTNPPTIENVACSNVTVVWLEWRRNTDRGNPDREIAQYEIYMSYNASAGANPEWTHVKNIAHNASVHEYRVLFANLVPDMFYTVRVDVRQQDDDKLMRYILDGKVSEEIYIPCTIPGPPRVLNITADVTSITLVLEEPVAPNGIIIQYHVSVAENEDFLSSFTKNFLKETDDKYFTATITNLLPDTTYFIKVSASTSVGTGKPSPTRLIVTMQSVPKPSANLTSDRSYRNETCVRLQWTHEDITNGDITGYNISYREAGITKGELKSVSTTNTSAHVCNLLPGRYCAFMVRASNPTGYSEVASVTLSTEQPDPPVPPIPEVLNTTATSIGVALDPVVMTSSSYEYGYLLSIVDVTAKTKRDVSTSHVTCPGIQKIPGTVIRNFTQAEIPSRISIIIGDGKQYGDFENKPLTRNNLYDVYYVITSYFEDVCKYTYVKTSTPVKAAPVPVVAPPGTQSSATNIVLIIGIVILVIIIIVGIIVFIFCWWRKRQSDQEYKPCCCKSCIMCGVYIFAIQLHH